MASGDSDTASRQSGQDSSEERQKLVSDLLGDEEMRSLLIQKLKESGHVEKNVGSRDEGNPFPNIVPPGGPGAWPTFPVQYPFAPFPASPFWGPVPSSPWVTGASNPQPSHGSACTSGQPGSSCTQGQEKKAEENEDEDVIDLLDESEALELVQFNPSVPEENAWEAGETINAFLEKHFQQPLAPKDRDAIKMDFPRPACTALSVPKLDEEIKDQIMKAGKNPHFGAEKSLFKIQERILEMAGPLTCLWSDMLNQTATVKQEDVLLLIQRVLVLLGGASHSITQERRRIAWGRVNPANTLPDDTEQSEEKEVTLFGGGFLERATKRIEKAKELEKVTGSKRGGAPPQKRAFQDKDPNDLRRFLEKGAPAKFGGRNSGRPKPYQQQHRRKFQKKGIGRTSN